MRQQKKQKDKPAIALVLCFCLMALVSVFVVKANIDKVRDHAAANKAADVVKEKAVNETETDSADIVDSKSNQEDPSSTATEFILPLKGEIIKEYSMDMPIYWPTLDQYMTHSGIDLAGSVGTQVKACSSGTVTKIYEDDRFGITVEVNHGNGITSLYGNLAKDDLIELGEIVTQGTILGKIGQSSLFEFDDPDHLHFALHQGDEPVDPAEYIKGL